MNDKGDIFIVGIPNNHELMSAQFDCKINHENKSVEQEYS